jgi:galactokinase
MDPRLGAEVRALFAVVFGAEPEGVAVAPGRVNLIGEHTDYNEGFVLPLAIDRDLAVAYRARTDGRLRVHSRERNQTWESALKELTPPRQAAWSDYVAGVAWALAGAGHGLAGVDLAVAGDVPVGAGLSSSAALEVATARALAAASGLPWDPVAMARLCQRAENDFVGMACGLMDQFAAACSREGRALLLDCRSLATEDVPLPETSAIVVMDTGVRRSLAHSAYNDRRAACESAVAALRRAAPDVRTLRDVTPELLSSERERLDPIVWKRAAHVVAECKRPLQMADALRRDDLAAAGGLMDESHASLRDLYEVSCAELDLMVELARAQQGCHGARMTGAGFGGCAVALVEREAAERFARSVEKACRGRRGLLASCFACRPQEGARLL